MAAMICDASESAILIAFLSFPDTTVPTHATLLESNKKDPRYSKACHTSGLASLS